MLRLAFLESVCNAGLVFTTIDMGGIDMYDEFGIGVEEAKNQKDFFLLHKTCDMSNARA
jgi:hypothetical protein